MLITLLDTILQSFIEINISKIVNNKFKIFEKILLFFIFSFSICFISHAGKKYNSEKSRDFETFKNKFERLCITHLQISTFSEKTVKKTIEEIAEDPSSETAKINLDLLTLCLGAMNLKVNFKSNNEEEKIEINNLKVGLFDLVYSLNNNDLKIKYFDLLLRTNFEIES